MNLNQIVNMVLRMVVNRVVRMGVDAGMNKIATLGQKREAPRPRDDTRA